jgi:hypothetical protein
MRSIGTIRIEANLLLSLRFIIILFLSLFSFVYRFEEMPELSENFIL